MICSIDDNARVALENAHIKTLHSLQKENKNLDLKDYLTSFYSRLLQPVNGVTRPIDKALSYIHLSPRIIRAILAADPDMESYFVDKGFDLNSLVKLDGYFTKSDTPLQRVVDYIGKQGIISQVKQYTEALNQTSQEGGYDPNGLAIGGESKFKAMPVSANTTTGQEALPGNIPDPGKVTRYTFQRNLINKILSGLPDSSKIEDYPGGLYLTAMHSSKVPEYKGTSPYLFVITDNDSNILSLDANGLTDGPREVMYFEPREVTKEGDVYKSKSDLSPISAIVKYYASIGIPKTLKEAEQIRQAQLKEAYDIQEHVKDPEATVKTLITGGSLGYTTFAQSIRTPVSSINFSGSPFSVKFQESEDGPFFTGAAYFTVKGIQDPILLQRNQISPELIDKLASTFVDPISEEHAGKTHPISDQARLRLIKQYLNNTPSLMTTLSKGKLILHLNDAAVDLSDTENAREQIKSYFGTYASTPGFDEGTLSQDKKDKALDVDDPNLKSKIYQGAIVKTSTPDGVTYDKYTAPSFNINKDFIKNPAAFDDYELEKSGNGLLYISKPTDYNSWLKKNTYINYELNKEGKILSLNSYFKYQLTDEAKGKLYEPNTKAEETTTKGAKQTQEPSEAVKSFIEQIKKEGLSKTSKGSQASEEQIQSAKTWYEGHPMSKYFGFQQAFDIVNSDRIALWTMSGITLYNGSDYSDLYHEAWHGFSQGFLTRDQKKDLYKEVSSMSGSFVNHEGKRVSFRKASYRDIEEYLAEDFRGYMLSGGKMLRAPVRNSIFRKIWNFLKALFGNTTYAQALINANATNTVRDLYEKLRVGNLNQYSFSASNPIFYRLAKGIVATDPQSIVKELSPDDSLTVVNTIDSIFSTLIDKLNSQSDTQYTNHLFSTDRGRQLAYETALAELKIKRKDLFWKKTQVKDDFEKESIQRNLDLLDFMVDNFGDPKDPRGEEQKDAEGNPIGIIAYHNTKSKFLSFEDKFMPEDTNTPESWAFKDGNEVSVYERGKSAVWYLIKGLHRMDSDGNPILNRLGFPELVDFPTTRRRLTKILASSMYDQMQPRLIENQDRYPFIRQLLSKLGDPNATDVNTLNMWSDFFFTFNSYRIVLPTVVIDKTSDRFVSKVGEAQGDHKITQRRWSNEFSSGRSGDPSIVIRKPGATPYLNVEAALRKYPKVNRTNLVSFLNDIGVPLDRSEDVMKEIQTEPDFDRMGTYLRDRLEALKKHKVKVDSLYVLFSENVENKYGEKKNESSRYDQIAKLQAKYSGLFSEQVSTPTGDTRSEYSLNQSITQAAKFINSADYFSDLLEGPMSYLDRQRNPWAAVSKRLNSLFDFNDQGKRRKSIVYQVENLNGLTLTEDQEATDVGSASSSADPFTKFVMDLHMLLQRGTPENPRHGEKSTSISTSSKYVSPYSKDGKLWMDPEHFLDTGVWKKMYFSIVPYLYAEHNRVMIMRNAKPGDPEFNSPDYLTNGKEFKVFEDMLSQSTKDKIYNLDKPLEEVIGSRKDLEQAISTDLAKYFQHLFDQAKERFSKAPFVADNVIDLFANKKKDNPFGGLSREHITNALLRAFEFNMWIHNMEAQIMHYGDEAQYKTAVEFNKRISMFSSTGDIFRTDDTMMRFINENMGMLYARSLGLPEKTFSSSISTAVMADPKVTSVYYNEIRQSLYDSLKARGWSDEDASLQADNEAKAYQNMKIGDAQGWITFDSYRALKKASGKWSDKQEALYHKIVNNKRVDHGEVLEYFPVVKYQFAGPAATKGLPINEGHKFSLVPLIPTLIKDAPVLQALHLKMINEGIDYSMLASASKISTVTDQGEMDKLYNNFEARTSSEKPFTKNVVPMDFLKDQQNVNSEYKESVTIATQMRKVIEESYMENGVPTDSKMSPEQWNALSETKKLESPKYKMIINYEKSVANLTEEKKKAFLKEIGWDGEEYGTVTEKLMTLIDKELARQDLSNHEREAIQLKGPDGKSLMYSDLSYHLSAEPIERKLASLLNTKLVRQKANGEPLVQVSGVGFESEDFRKATPEERLKYGTNDLTFYRNKGRRDKDGNLVTSAAKAKVSFMPSFDPMLQLTHTDNLPVQTLDRLNEVIKDEKWLDIGDHRRMITMVGPRIPVEEQNSMEFEEVYHFLPRESGNIIIHPAEIVAKTGSDFDVDKVSMMLPNIKFDKIQGVILYKAHTDKEARAMYEQYKKYKAIEKRLETPDLQDEASAKLMYRIFELEAKGIKKDELEEAIRSGRAKSFEEFERELAAEERDLGEIIQLMMENKEIRTFEEFKESLSGTKAAENEYIYNCQKLLEHPDNYANLVRPNGTFTLDPIVNGRFDKDGNLVKEGIRDYVTEYDPKKRVHGGPENTVSFSRLNEYGYNHYVHQINKVSQEALGQAATDNTANVNFNRVGAHMSYSYKDKTTKSPISKAVEKKITLQLPHNTMKDEQGRNVVSLSHLLDADGRERISGNIAQAINLLLEVAKNDSAPYLSLNKEATPVITFLNQAGVPFEHLAYFISQPIVRAYLNEVRLARSPIADAIGKAPEGSRNYFQNKARGVMLTDPKYGFGLDDKQLPHSNPRTMKGIALVYQMTKDLIEANPNAFGKERLYDKIVSSGKGTPIDQIPITQEDKAVLLHFFEIEDMAKAVSKIKMSLNFDTKRSTSAFSALSKIKQIELLTSDGKIPEKVVERIVNDSAISSLYNQPFMVDFLRPLFPVRSNKVIGDFLLSRMSSPGAMEAIESTFGDADRFTTRFFNDLMSYIFQNKLRDFKISEVKQYRNLNADESVDVKQVPYLKFGAFVKDGKMYYDLDQIVKDYTEKNYSGKSYRDRGLATIKPTYFATAKEFYNYVFEREYVRWTSPAEYVSDDDRFRRLLDEAKGDKALAYEEYIRDRALENIGNGKQLFEGETSYADQVMDTIDKYRETLIKRYPILETLAISKSRGKGTSMRNLQLLDTDLTGDKVDVFHQVLSELADPAVEKTANRNENLRISDLFHKFPMVAFLQSGLNTTGSFSLVRLVPSKTFLDFMQGAVKEFVGRLNEPRLERFYQAFITNNRRSTKARYRDYTASDSSTGVRPIVHNPVTIYDSGLGFLTFDPASLNEKNAKAAVESNDSVFVYDKSIDKPGGFVVGTNGYLGSKAITTNRTLGLPTKTSYADIPGRSVTDDTLEKNKVLIDEAINDLKDLSSEHKIAFDRNGYGQGLINLKYDGVTPLNKSQDKPGLKTFMYLSQRLFEEFGYVNKNYDIQIAPIEEATPEEVLSEGAPVSDEEVRDTIKNCIGNL